GVRKGGGGGPHLEVFGRRVDQELAAVRAAVGVENLRHHGRAAAVSGNGLFVRPGHDKATVGERRDRTRNLIARRRGVDYEFVVPCDRIRHRPLPSVCSASFPSLIRRTASLACFTPCAAAF